MKFELRNYQKQAYQYAFDKMKDEIEWASGFSSTPLQDIKKTHFGFGCKEYEVGLKYNNVNILVVRIGMDDKDTFEFSTDKIFNDVMQQKRGQMALF